ncbi:MAG: hypothetical protein WEB58_19315 [Planctomycetaceae bacterium]
MSSTTNVRNSAVLVLGVMVGTLFAGNRAISQDGSDVKTQIFNAWRERQKQIKSVEFEWTQVSELKYTADRQREAEAFLRQPKLGDFYKKEQRSSLRLDGERFDYRLDTTNGSPNYNPTGHRTAFDGNQARYYSGTSRRGTVGSGIIRSELPSFDINSIFIRPLILAYRATHPRIGRLDENSHRVLPDRYPVGDFSCIVLEEIGAGPFLRSYWVDPEHGFIVRRYQTTVEGRNDSRMDISYEQDSVHGWVPKVWTIINLDENGDLRSSTVCTVTNFSINKTIPLKEFQLSFPPGTRVIDEVKGKKFISGGWHWFRQWAFGNAFLNNKGHDKG